MPEIRGITIAVGEWYARTLEICLVRNMRHMTECLVVTTPQDDAVKAVVAKVPGARVFETDAFTRHGARFNKGLGIEEGFDALGRHGWLWIWDADCLAPDHFPQDNLRPGFLHGCTRRILEDPRRWSPSLDWRVCPQARDGGPIGYCQVFQADDPVLAHRRPWYDVSFAHAGGGDAAFMGLWPKSRHAMLPMDVLHLGPRDTHWFGVDQEGKDMMSAFVVRNGWERRNPRVDRTAVDRVGAIVERVEVPGYAPSSFELPFVRKARGG